MILENRDRHHTVLAEPLNETGHRFLSSYTDEEIRQGVAEMGADRRRQLIERAFPGKMLETPFSSVEAALDSANANFTVKKFPMIAVLPPAKEGDEPQAVPVPNKVALTRTDTDTVLGVAGDTYGIVQNAEAFAAASVLCEQRSMDIHAVQVIDGGARVRISGLIGESVIDQLGRGPDVLAHYATFEAAHDGIHSVKGCLDTLRIACFNGMTARTKESAFTVRHSSKASDRNKEAQKALLTIQQAAQAEAEIFQHLAQEQMTTKMFRQFASELIDAVRGELDDEATDRKKAKREADINELERLFGHGAGNVGQSAYDGYNAITDWVTTRRDQAKDAIAFAKKYESATTGYNNRIKARALKMLTR